MQLPRRDCELWGLWLCCCLAVSLGTTKQDHCSHTRTSFIATDRQSDRKKKKRQSARSRRTQQATQICGLVPRAQLGEMPPRRTSPPKTRKNISHEPIVTADDAQLDKGGGRGGAGGSSLVRAATVVTVRVPRFLKHPSGHTVYACCVEMPPTRQVRVSYTMGVQSREKSTANFRHVRTST